MKSKNLFIFLISSVPLLNISAQEISVNYNFSNNYFPLVYQSKAASIFVDPSDYKVVTLAANALQEDISDITNQKPLVNTSTALSSYPVIIGTVGHSQLIDSLIRLKKLNVDSIQNKWESFTLQIIKQPFKDVKQALVIAGASYLEYKLKLSKGNHTITVKCLPTQSIDADKKLLLGISVNGAAIQTINIHSESESGEWKQNVVRGYAEGKVNCTINKEETLLRIYFPEAGLVLNAIEID